MNRNQRPALPNKVCMQFDDETLDSCGEPATEVARIEIPLGSLTAVQLQEVVRMRAESMPTTTKFGYKADKAYRRRVETTAAHPSEGGCFIVIDLYLCLEHIADMYNGQQAIRLFSQ